jgi:hypothetical protein
MHKFMIAAVLAIALPAAAVAQSSSSTDGIDPAKKIPPGTSASVGDATGETGKTEAPTSPQEKADKGPNLPPSQRVDPENPASPGVNGTESK